MKVIRYILYILITAFLPVSCVVSEIKEDPLLGDGVTSVTMDIQFRPMAAALDDSATKSAGNSIKHINDLWVVVYKNDGNDVTFFEKVKVSHDTDRVSNYQNTELDVTETGFAESKYCHSTFDMELPLGKYRIYAVANYDLSSFAGTEDELKSIKLTWNASNIAANNAMFGYFTDGEDMGSAQDITIDRSGKSLHAFVKRAASKVTVSFDGSNMYENIYIYLHTVQIRDIPATCLLGKDNTPSTANHLISNGEIQYLRPKGSTDQTGGIRITKGDPTGGREKEAVHSETADALFFYENMQGTDPKKHQYNNFESKDNKPFGTYIEVKGYYVNKNADAASQGPIIYRFMLGKNVTDDFNAERSNHYKLVLKFKNNANDPDWHIEYVSESPELTVPNPLYISYGYNESLDIPIVIQGQTVTNFSAKIIDNPWGYDEHKYSQYQTENYNGFLSFKHRTAITITESERKAWAGSTEETMTAPTSKTETNVGWQYKLRVWTRPLTLQTSFTGHNPFTGYQRIATVRVTATIDGVKKTMDTKVIQVRRAVNPVGIWRSGDKQTPFNVTLMEMDGEDTGESGYLAKSFFPTISDGPWSAEIIEGSDWVQIKNHDTEAWDNKQIIGSTGSTICFDYRPGSTISNSSYRCGVIKVLYHNFNCVHYIFVSQGLGTVNLAGTKWQTRNVEYNGKLVANPLLEGCMFKFGDSNKAFLPENNITWGWKVETDNPSARKAYKVYDTYNRTTPQLLTNANYETATFDPTGFTSMKAEGGVPPIKAQWVALESLRRYYGVMYGDECTETIDRTVAEYDPNGTDAYMYMAVGQTKGMQGVFIWDDSRGGNHTFFPLSSTGFGHRKAADMYHYSWGLNPANIKYGVLQYGQRSYYFPDSSTGWDGNGKNITVASKLPVFYDLWLRKGVIYWYRERFFSGTDAAAAGNYDYAHDFNYFTMGFNTYGANNLDQTSSVIDCDLCFIRCVEP